MIHEGLGVAMRAVARGDPAKLRAAGQQLIRASAGAALRATFADYVRSRRRGGDRSAAATLASDFAGGEGNEAVVRALVRGLPLSLRWPATRLVAAAAVLAAAMLGATAFWLRQPAELRVAQFASFAMADGLDRPIIVEVVDRAGRVNGSSSGMVKAEFEDSTEGVLAGHTVVPVKHGRAVFDSVRVSGVPTEKASGWSRIRFTHGELTALVSDSLIVNGNAVRLRLDSARVNHQLLTPASRRLVIRPGETVRGTVYLDYVTHPGAHSIILAVAPTWGDRRDTPVGRALEDGAAGKPTTIGLDLPGPAEPGRYRIVFAFAYETESRFVASATNWLYGAPRWDDGNDLADITEDQAQRLDRQGYIWWPWLMAKSTSPAGLDANAMLVRGRIPAEDELPSQNWLAGTTLEVVVE